MMSIRILSVGLIMVLLATLTGCGATHTAINKRNLDVQTRMSDSIFLDPVTVDKHSIFVQIRNTSDKPELALEEKVREALICKGYRLVASPEQAHYLLQANVLQVGKSDLRAAEHALSQGFGAALTGAVVGATIAGLAPASSRHEKNERMVAGGFLGAAVATVTDAMVHDVAYCVITDVQISEKVGNATKVKEKTKSKLRQGNSGIREITSTEQVDWKRYQTRVVSTANQVNLKFEKALPELMQGITRSVAGLF